MEALPLISIIVPVYRVEDYLDKCLSSLVGQTYENLEILLVDDGSPDRSGERCDQWAARDSRIQVIHQENGGAGKARNAALDIARGEFIGFVDSDDYIAPRMYEHLYGLMTEETDIVECVGLATGDDGCPLDADAAPELIRVDRVEAMRLNIRDEMFTQLIWNKLYRRSVIGEIRFPEGKLIDDEFFTYKVIGNARQLVHSSCCLYAYRQQPGSVMHKPYSLRRLQGVEAYRERLDYLQERMPELMYEAKVGLFFACVYAMQMTMLWLTGEERERADSRIRQIVAEITPLPLRTENGLKNNIWLALGQISFDGLCKFQNYLESRNR